MNHPIYPGVILGNRYRIVRQLGHGGFGRTYLAEDNYRFQENCVLKEFAPRVESGYAWQKGQELFAREANILYKLQHLQIPKFREVLNLDLDGKSYLFLVQEYVAGPTYQDLLKARLHQGIKFNELEMIQFLRLILPVLDYIHSLGVIHRDISPDNIILREADQIPVLIDFGGVKQVAVAIESEIGNDYTLPHNQATKIGKIGYAPEEQMRLGMIYPNSDLYALAVTVLVLLTGEEPSKLIDNYSLNWNWRSKCSISPQLGKILDQMLAIKPSDRFQSASLVLNALQQIPTILVAPANQIGNLPEYPLEYQINTNYQMTKSPQSQKLNAPSSINKLKKWLNFRKLNWQWENWQFPSLATIILLTLIIMVVTGSIGWSLGKFWVKWQQKTPLSAMTEQENKDDQAAQDKVYEMVQKLGIDNNFYLRLVDELFYHKYPELEGRALTDLPEDNQWRKRWLEQANILLDSLQEISAESRQKLGLYTLDDVRYRRTEANKIHLSSHTLNDLADAKFFYLFPQYSRDESLLDLLIGQVWQAIASDQLEALKSGKILREIQFDRGNRRKTVRSELKPGEGKVYLVRWRRNYTAELELKASPEQTLLSIYPPADEDNPNDPLLEDSKEKNWSHALTRTGYYEIVVVSTTKKSTISYQIVLKLMNK